MVKAALQLRPLSTRRVKKYSTVRTKSAFHDHFFSEVSLNKSILWHMLKLRRYNLKPLFYHLAEFQALRSLDFCVVVF
jgi:hypothetical protein